jgi:cytosine/adenosine deaminase-related metal-dependent hydrolase
MSGTTQSADLLIEGAIVITMDAERRIFSDGAVAIGEGRILAVGGTPEVTSAFQAERRISGKGMVAIPGLINAHSHFFPFVKGAIPEKHSADAVRRDYLYPFFRDLTAEEEAAGAEARMWEMIRTGTTCFADGGCKHVEVVAQATEKMGLRGVLGGWRCDLAEDGAAQDENHGVRADTEQILAELEEDLQRQTSGRVKMSATLVDERVVSEKLFQGAVELAGRYETTLSVDVAVTKEAGEETRRNRGLRPVQWMKEIGVLGDRVILNHATDLGPDDMSAIAETGAAVCWTPSAALRRGHGTTQPGCIPELVKAGAGVSLGTDGPASSDYADMVRVMYLAATLPVDSRINHAAGSSEAALEMGTVNGAKALGMDGEIGSLETGKKADLVLMDVERPEWRPLFHPVNNLIFSASGDSVKTVIVDGRMILEDGRLAVVDETELLESAKSLRGKMRERLARYPS